MKFKVRREKKKVIRAQQLFLSAHTSNYPEEDNATLLMPLWKAAFDYRETSHALLRECEGLQFIRTQQLFLCAHTSNYHEEDNAMFLMSLWKAAFDYKEAPYALSKEYGGLSFANACYACVNHFYFLIIFILVERMNYMLFKLIITKKIIIKMLKCP